MQSLPGAAGEFLCFPGTLQCREGRQCAPGRRGQRAQFSCLPGPWLHRLAACCVLSPWVKWERRPSPSWEEWSQSNVLG